MLFVVLLFFSVLFDLVLYLAGGKEKMKDDHLRNTRRRLSRKSFFLNETISPSSSSSSSDSDDKLSPFSGGSSSSKQMGLDLEIALGRQPLLKRPRSSNDYSVVGPEATVVVVDYSEHDTRVTADFHLLTPEEKERRDGRLLVCPTSSTSLPSSSSSSSSSLSSSLDEYYTSSATLAARPHTGGTIRDYEFLKLIQQGGVGAVYLTKHKTSGQKYAIKVLKKTTEKLTSLARKEANTMLKLKSGKHIVQLCDLIESEANIFLVMQWGIGGDLFAYVENRKKVDEEDVWRIFGQVIEAVAFAHAQGIIHRDIKPGKLASIILELFVKKKKTN